MTFTNNIYSQIATFVSYDCKTKEVKTIPPPQIDEIKIFDHTDWFIGQDSINALLDTNKPTNPMPGSGFTEKVTAQLLFKVSDFPVRAAVKLYSYENGEQKESCTGMMIGRKYVLSAAHVILNVSLNKIPHQFHDSILVAPAFDNNMINKTFGTSMSSKLYVPDRYHKETYRADDIGIIELDKEIGYKTGWIGLAFSSDLDYYQDKVFHQLGYPRASPYNGDTLYYSYGTLDIIDNNFVGLGYYGRAVPGQSGSSLFYTDNSNYYTFGTLRGNVLLGTIDYEPPDQYAVYNRKIDSRIFYALKNIITNESASLILAQPQHPNKFKLKQNYPNPFNPSTTIKYYLSKPGNIILKIYNLTGQEIETLVNGFQSAGAHQITWQPKDLPSGVYFYRLQAGEFSETMKLILQK